MRKLHAIIIFLFLFSGIASGASLILPTPSADSMLIGSSPNYNAGSLSWSYFAWGDYKMILSFNASATSGKCITTATMTINTKALIGSDPILVRAYLCTRTNWVENQVTNTIYKTGSNWTTPGGDYDPTIYSDIVNVHGSTGNKTFDITPIATWSAANANGINSILIRQTAGTSGVEVWLRESAYDPAMTITYEDCSVGAGIFGGPTTWGLIR